MQKIKKLTLSNSALEDFKACPYSFYKKYILKQELPQDSTSVDFGTAIHAFIEEVTKDASQDIPALMTRLHAEYGLPKVGYGSYLQFSSACRKYAKQNMNSSGEDYQYPVLEHDKLGKLLEVKLEAPIDAKEGLYVSGTIDRIARTHGGQIVIFDTKSTRRPYYWTKNDNQKVHIHPQITHYFYLASQNGLTPDLGVIDIVPTEKGMCTRVSTTRSKELVAQWLADTKFYCSLIKQCLESGTFARNVGESCLAYGGCGYLKHCMNPKAKEPSYMIPKYQGVIIEYVDK